MGETKKRKRKEKRRRRKPYVPPAILEEESFAGEVLRLTRNLAAEDSPPEKLTEALDELLGNREYRKIITDVCSDDWRGVLEEAKTLLLDQLLREGRG